MTLAELLAWCSDNNIPSNRACLVIADKDTEDDFTEVSHCVWNGQQLILYKSREYEDA